MAPADTLKILNDVDDDGQVPMLPCKWCKKKGIKGLMMHNISGCMWNPANAQKRCQKCIKAGRSEEQSKRHESGNCIHDLKRPSSQQVNATKAAKKARPRQPSNKDALEESDSDGSDSD